MKKLSLFLIVILLSFSSSYGQACGTSKRTILLKFEDGGKVPDRIGYELFYLAPKGTGADKNDMTRLARFLSKFLYDDENAKKNRFWSSYGLQDDPFLPVPAEKAERYVSGYKLKDFEDFYTVSYRKNQLPQLRGNFVKGVLELVTEETDITPFIMRIKFEGYETLYLLDSFLGGCFDPSAPHQIILMKRKTGR